MSLNALDRVMTEQGKSEISTGNSQEADWKRVKSRRNHVKLFLRPTADWPVLCENQAANISARRFFQFLVLTGRLADTPRLEFAIGIHSAGQSEGVTNREPVAAETATHDNSQRCAHLRLDCRRTTTISPEAAVSESIFMGLRPAAKGVKATKELARSLLGLDRP
jgi:hypothetical protein